LHGAIRECSIAEIEQARTDGATGPVRIDALSVLKSGRHIASQWGLAASSDGRWFATAGFDRTVKLWDARTLKQVRCFDEFAGQVWCVAFSPDSTKLATGSESVKLWDVRNGRLLCEYKGHTALVMALAFHPTEPCLVSGGADGIVRRYDLESGQDCGVLHRFTRAVKNLAFHPQGRWLAAAHAREVPIWKWQAHPPHAAAAPDRVLTGHTGAVWSVAFSADGRYFASGGDQGKVLLRDGDTLEKITALPTDTGQVRALAFSHDTRFLALGPYSGAGMVWDLQRLRDTLREMSLDW
jgi:WD40 repeat protein